MKSGNKKEKRTREGEREGNEVAKEKAVVMCVEGFCDSKINEYECIEGKWGEKEKWGIRRIGDGNCGAKAAAVVTKKGSQYSSQLL